MGKGAEVALGCFGHTHSYTERVAFSSYIGWWHWWSPRSFRAACHGQQWGQVFSVPLTCLNNHWKVNGGRPQVSAREHFRKQMRLRHWKQVSPILCPVSPLPIGSACNQNREDIPCIWRMRNGTPAYHFSSMQEACKDGPEVRNYLPRCIILLYVRRKLLSLDQLSRILFLCLRGHLSEATSV